METPINKIIIDFSYEYNLAESLIQPIIQKLNQEFFIRIKDMKYLSFDKWKDHNLPENLYNILKEKYDKTLKLEESKSKELIKKGKKTSFKYMNIFQDNSFTIGNEKIQKEIQIIKKESINSNEIEKNLTNLENKIKDHLTMKNIYKIIDVMLHNIISNFSVERFKKINIKKINIKYPYDEIMEIFNLMKFDKIPNSDYIEYTKGLDLLSDSYKIINNRRKQYNEIKENINNQIKTNITELNENLNNGNNDNNINDNFKNGEKIIPTNNINQDLNKNNRKDNLNEIQKNIETNEDKNNEKPKIGIKIKEDVQNSSLAPDKYTQSKKNINENITIIDNHVQQNIVNSPNSQINDNNINNNQISDNQNYINSGNNISQFNNQFQNNNIQNNQSQINYNIQNKNNQIENKNQFNNINLNQNNFQNNQFLENNINNNILNNTNDNNEYNYQINTQFETEKINPNNNYVNNRIIYSTRIPSNYKNSIPYQNQNNLNQFQLNSKSNMSKSINLVNPNSNNRYINQINNFSPEEPINNYNNQENVKKNIHKSQILNFLNPLYQDKTIPELLIEENSRRNNIILNTPINHNPSCFFITNIKNIDKLLKKYSVQHIYQEKDPNHIETLSKIINIQTNEYNKNESNKLKKLIENPIITKGDIYFIFPDKYVIKTTFCLYEKVKDLYQFIQNYLNSSKDSFRLYNNNNIIDLMNLDIMELNLSFPIPLNVTFKNAYNGLKENELNNLTINVF